MDNELYQSQITCDINGAGFDFNFDELIPLEKIDSHGVAGLSNDSIRSAGTTTHKSRASKARKSKDAIKPPRRAKLPRATASASAALSSSQVKPNMSRRRPFENVIVAFPSFDKCDSLVYFPSTFTRHLNNGDMTALWKLFVSHLDRNCDISMANCYRFKEHSLRPQLFLKSYELLNELQPDRIMCVDSTKIEENRIKSSIHMKFTDSKVIYDSVARNVVEPQLQHMVPSDRRQSLRHKILTMEKHGEIQNELYTLVDTDTDLLLYVHLFMDITFDDFTRKITALHFHGCLTSMHPVNTNFSNGSL